jgi:hypothetical protein
MLSKECFEFGDVVALGVMLLLITDVVSHCITIRCADTEGGVSGLPCKEFRSVLVHPARAVCFELLGEFRDGDFGREFDEKMNVVVNASDLDGLAFKILCDAVEVCPEFWLNFSMDAWMSFFAREDDMNEDNDVRIGHGPMINANFAELRGNLQ